MNFIKILNVKMDIALGVNNVQEALAAQKTAQEKCHVMSVDLI